MFRYLLIGFSLFAASALADLPKIDFLPLPAGSFQMGTADIDAVYLEHPKGQEAPIGDEQPAHEVRLSKDIEMSRTEITQGQWFDLMGSKPGPDEYWQRKDWRQLPAVSISWYMAQNFVKVMNQEDAKHHYRLPTEAEWEYAARAGTTGLRHVPDEVIGESAWYIENSGDAPHPVASKKANAWGFHDMLGNAWEWTADGYDPEAYKNGPRVDPKGSERSPRRVRRGGSYHCPTHMLRIGYRAVDKPESQFSVLGFRVVRTVQ